MLAEISPKTGIKNGGHFQLGKYFLAYGNLCHLENSISALSQNLSSNLYEFHKQSPKRPVLDITRKNQAPQKVA
jgi:hypothetical protein